MPGPSVCPVPDDMPAAGNTYLVQSPSAPDTYAAVQEQYVREQETADRRLPASGQA
jgi:hypothetical protein